MNENNAAKAAIRDWDNAVACAQHAPTTGMVMLESSTVLEVAALLSKLRGPVADERAAFEASYRSRFNVPAHAGLTFPDVAEAWKWWQRRAALASAPVAQPKRAPVDDGICWTSKEIQRRQKEEDDARAAYYHSRASAPVAGEAKHPDDTAVDRFAAAMKAKLAEKREQGYGGWDDEECTAHWLSQLLRGHVEKGDPLDVGNFAMMLHQRGERITDAAPQASEAVPAQHLSADELAGFMGDPSAMAALADGLESIKGNENAELAAVIVRSLIRSDAAPSVAGEAQAEQFIQAAIDRAPEPLRRLGEYLSRVLDEDQWSTAERMLLGACDAAPQASEAVPGCLLAAEHIGMTVDYTGLFGQARSALKRGENAPAMAEMLRQMAVHLTELGKRWYAGDAAVVDEFLQLYCIESDTRAALSAQPGAQKGGGDAK